MIATCGGCDCGHAANTPGAPVSIELRPPPPRATPPWYHVVTGERPLAFIVDSSALFEISDAFASDLARHDTSAENELADYRPLSTAMYELGTLPAPAAISLNVAQSCNLACSYCYADEGRFGGSPRRMTQATARSAVDDLIGTAAPGDSILVGFIGGEPLLNRSVVHDCVSYTTERARHKGLRARFSITTNGTLLEPSDVDLFRANPFAVTVSIDGGQRTHDQHRHRRDGTGSWRQITERVGGLLARPGLARVSARATVSRDDLDIARIVDELAAAGFTEIGVSPVRAAPDPALVLRDSDWDAYLNGLVDAAGHELARLHRDGGADGWRFANFGNALSEIHRGTARPLPCGAAYGYVSVDVDGRYATCHRTVGDPQFDLGAIGALSEQARREFLSTRMVDTQQPCRSCWARYLCGGGCHAEVAQVGRSGCDMIRGWLDFCLNAYPDVLASYPELFSNATRAERLTNHG